MSAFYLDTLADWCATVWLRISNTLVKFTVTSRWERHYTVKAEHMVDNSVTQHYLVHWPRNFCANRILT